MKQGTRFFAFLLVLTMLFSLSAMAVSVPDQATSLEGKVVILHTNDSHGADLAVAGTSIGTAGVAKLRSTYEAAGAEVILISAGDAIQGSPLVNLSRGVSAIEFMNLAGYDLMVPGNHEFDWGTDNLLALEALADFPFISANIYNSETKTSLFSPSISFDTVLGKIGVFGITTPETATKAHPDKVKGTSFSAEDEMYADAKFQVDKLISEGCEYIIAVAHLGIEDGSAPNRSIDLAEKVSGIDIIIDGHCHSILDGSDGANKYGGTLIVSAGEKLSNVGVITLDEASYTAGLISAADYSETDEAVAAAIKAENDKVEEELSAVFAESEVLLDGNRDPGVRTMETNLGDFAADAILWGALFALGDDKVDASITNGGGIRASIKAGDITMKDMATVFPFSNTIATVELTGEKLLEALAAATYSSPEAVGAFPQVSGIEFTIKTAVPYVNGEKYEDSTYYAPKNPAERIVDVKVGGKALELEKTYTIATNDFTASGGDTYGAFKNAVVYDTGVALEDALVAYTTEELNGLVTAEKYGKAAGRINIDQTPLDVDLNAWYYQSVMSAIDKGLMNGVGEGYFAPEVNVQRSMAVTILHRLAGSPEPENEGSFTDVAGGTWYADAVNWAFENGIVEGMGGGLFAPEENVSREQLAAMIYRYEKFTGGGFQDVWAFLLDYVDRDSISDWAYESVCWMTVNSIMSGMPGKLFAPQETATRAQLATMLANYIELED